MFDFKRKLIMIFTFKFSPYRIKLQRNKVEYQRDLQKRFGMRGPKLINDEAVGA